MLHKIIYIQKKISNDPNKFCKQVQFIILPSLITSFDNPTIETKYLKWMGNWLLLYVMWFYLMYTFSCNITGRNKISWRVGREYVLLHEGRMYTGVGSGWLRNNQPRKCSSIAKFGRKQGWLMKII